MTNSDAHMIEKCALADERALREAVRKGDEDAFRGIVERHRAELHAHCYRMLGSLQDAEDAVQDTLLRAWRRMHAFEGRSSLRTWLYKIATNVCLDEIARRRTRVPHVDCGPRAAEGGDRGRPLVESVRIELYPDETVGLDGGYPAPEARYEQQEAVEHAFVAALQHLTARQRAVLILREVLGFSAREVSESLETTVASVNSALQRARKSVEERLPARSEQAALHTLGDRKIRRLVDAYVDAWSNGDVDALRALLAEDLRLPTPVWAGRWRGRERVAGFAGTAVDVCATARALRICAYGQPSVAY